MFKRNDLTIISVLLVMIVLAGCAPIDYVTDVALRDLFTSSWRSMEESRERLGQVEVGMTPGKVEMITGREPLEVSYQGKDPFCDAEAVDSTLHICDKEVMIQLFLITCEDSECRNGKYTPAVYESRSLKGVGYAFFEETVNKYNLDVDLPQVRTRYSTVTLDQEWKVE